MSHSDSTVRFGLLVLLLACRPGTPSEATRAVQAQATPRPDSNSADTLSLAKYATPGAPISGIYTFWIGDDARLLADTSYALARGTLVLWQWDLPKDSLAMREQTRRWYINQSGGLSLWGACFRFDTDHPATGTFAGIVPRSTTVPSIYLPTPVLHFPLYQSPDAFYTVEAAVTADGLVGVGRAFGFGFKDGSLQSQYFVARRRGAPARSLC